PCWVRGVEAIERAAEKARCERHVVAGERAPTGRREMARRALAEGSAVRIDGPKLAQVLMRLLEMPSERLVVLDGVADLRFDPVREAGVQLGARPFEDAPIGGVADQHV